MRWFILIALIYFTVNLFAQENGSDSSRLLQEIVIEAYETDRVLREVPATIGYITSEAVERFSSTSILPAVNTIPGVRMEERSPGSYRFSIRGSSLRSPFGVRNVKVYWNGLPFTDGGGNTYLNLLDIASAGSIEIIKGPGGSLYGAGTGGVLLLKSPEVSNNQLQATAVRGGYGLHRYLLAGQMQGEKVSAKIQFTDHRSDGYRQQTALKRSMLSTDVKITTTPDNILSATVFYSELSYGTPGGLTLTQFQQDPRQARPPSASLGAVEARAAVMNQTVFGGMMYDHRWNERWKTAIGAYGGFSAFENPTIRNYEERDETNLGLRSVTEYELLSSQSALNGKVTFGMEFQHFKSPIAVYDNSFGSPGAIQVRDEISSNVGLVFGQVDFQFPSDIFLTAGASINFLGYDFLRKEPEPRLSQERIFDAVFSPRIAMLKKFSETVSIFGSYSNGFSPPSLAEVRPSTNTFSNSLKPEAGNNAEAGVRGNLLHGRLNYDLTLYDFRLRNTIVVQRNAEGADYFINAGKTSQRGMEALVSFDAGNPQVLLSLFKVWASYAYQHYRFKDYIVVDQDYSGNKLTGTAPTVFSTGLDIGLRRKFTTNILLNYVDHIPLDDANSLFAKPYLLLGVRMGYKAPIRQSALEFFAGVDNALDETYSLGNDLNAFGGRFFNAAMPRNYYGGISLTLSSDE
jgi:iron complex outermembrane receptor protein